MERSGDRKVTVLARWEEKKEAWKPVVKNTVGTLAGVTCPGMTEWCMSEKGAKCYAWKLERYYKAARSLVERNTVALENASSIKEKTVLYNQAVEDFLKDLTLAQKRVPWDLPKVFRWFWDGDVRTKNDARAIRAVAVKHPDVSFWQYTRSFDLVKYLVGPPNLVLYLSVDRYNIDAAKACKEENPSVKLAFCGDDWIETEEIAGKFPEERKGPKCPALTKKIPLVVDKGNGYGVGACAVCELCVFGRNNVRFSAKKGH